MGDLVAFPKREAEPAASVIAETWHAIHTAYTFGSLSIVFARDVLGRSADGDRLFGEHVAVILTGIEPEQEFEMLATFRHNDAGLSLAQAIADAIYVFALHYGPDASDGAA